MAEKLLWNDGWKFCECPLDAASMEMPGEEHFSPVDLPHDWMISDTHALYRDSIGWYRKRFSVSELERKHTSVRFDGVYMDTTVYLNGTEIGQWKYGYSTFEFDLTDTLKDGENEISVRVVYRSPNTRWYSGAGIYRNVWLKTSPATYLAADGIYITPRKRENGWTVEIDTEVVFGAQPVDRLRQRLFAPDGRLEAECQCMIIYEEQGSSVGRIHQELVISDPQLWDIAKGNLYTLRTELMSKKMVLEQEEQRFGLRTMQFDPDQGFLLNGRKVKINGVCEHHDLGCLGAAFNKTAMKRKLTMLRSMGVNAIRTSHNMPAPELMDLTDEMGFLVDSEAFDMWERSKTENDYARFFPEWMEKDVRSWVRRDRNRASLMMWSIGNEIYDTHADKRGQEVTRMLKEAVEANDPKRHAPVTIGSNYMQWENAQKCADILKIAGYNYAERLYEDHHKKHPDWVIYGSETASVLSSRGIYHFPLETSILTDEDEQCSALGNCTTSWGAKNCEAFLTADRDAEFSMGQFLWTGFDYIGEPTPYQTKNSYFGQIDTAGFPKDAYYICKSQWTDYRTDPMVHIFPYWDFNPGQIIDVRVCSNAPKIELFLNNVSQGTVTIDHAHGHDLIGHWKLAYVPGELCAVAYDENGEAIAEDKQESFGDPVRISMKPDKTIVKANGRDLIFVEIRVKDQEGRYVENARNRVKVEVTGAGRLVGLDNGDSTDFDPYKGISRRLFSGRLLAVIASNTEPGRISIRVSGTGLKSCEQRYDSIRSSHTKGVAASFTCTEQTMYAGGIGGGPVSINEVPVRKIELTAPQGAVFTSDVKELPVEVRLFPGGVNTELIWKVTNERGIESDLASIRETPHGAVVTAKGDGKFELRCATKNQGTIPSVVSAISFTAVGIGQPILNPYEEICGGLYTRSSGTVMPGLAKGLLLSGEGEAAAVFDGLDFGDYGSDTVTLPIFTTESGPVQLQLWTDLPSAPGSEKLGDFIYQKPSRWEVYQEETFVLPRRLKEISSFCIVSTEKLHIRGVVFKKYEKALQTLQAVECSQIYGDSYRMAPGAVLGIGNNVSVVFEDMNFPEDGVDAVRICGRSALEKNTIHIRFHGTDGESVQLAEFAGSEDWSEQDFDLEPLKGAGTISFVFLPGCSFDFKSFRFYKKEDGNQ